MIASTETTQLHPLAVGDFLRITITPLYRNVAIGVGVDQHVEGTIPSKLRQESDRGCDLSEDGRNFVLNFLLGLLGLRGIGAGSVE